MRTIFTISFFFLLTGCFKVDGDGHVRCLLGDRYIILSENSNPLKWHASVCVPEKVDLGNEDDRVALENALVDEIDGEFKDRASKICWDLADAHNKELSEKVKPKLEYVFDDGPTYKGKCVSKGQAENFPEE